MTNAPIAVTGVTGHIGGRVARHLADAQAPIRLLVRDTAPGELERVTDDVPRLLGRPATPLADVFGARTRSTP